MEFMFASKLFVLDKGNESTFLDPRSQEVIDIIICTRGLRHRVKHWRVLENPLSSITDRYILVSVRCR